LIRVTFVKAILSTAIARVAAQFQEMKLPVNLKQENFEIYKTRKFEISKPAISKVQEKSSISAATF